MIGNFKLFTGRSNLPLAQKISDYLGAPLGAVKTAGGIHPVRRHS